MDVLTLALLISTTVWVLNGKAQRRRVALLASQLGQYQIEKLMEALTDGYLRAMGETQDERRDQIWRLLSTTESQLAEQFNQFANAFGQLDAASTRVSRLPIALPYAEVWLPQATFDLRAALSVHARGITQVLHNSSHMSARDRAFMATAELLLMQHTCHWFCKSKTIASARMLARHKTPYEQLIASVSPETRAAYLSLTRG